MNCNITVLFIVITMLASCSQKKDVQKYSWEKHGKLMVPDGSTLIHHEDGTPFLWIGCTSWGMTEWMSREDVELYLVTTVYIKMYFEWITSKGAFYRNHGFI